MVLIMTGKWTKSNCNWLKWSLHLAVICILTSISWGDDSLEEIGYGTLWHLRDKDRFTPDELKSAQQYLREHEGTGVSSTKWTVSQEELATLIDAMNRPKILELSGPAVTDSVLRKIGQNSEALTSLWIRAGDLSTWYEKPESFSGEGLANLTFPQLLQFDFGFIYVEDHPTLHGVGAIGGSNYSTRSQFAETGMAALATAPQLRAVGLVDCLIRDSYLKHLAGAQELRSLNLNGNPLTGDGLKHLAACAQLKGLSLASCSLTDEGLQQLPPLPDLELLNLFNNQITDGALLKLTKARFPKLRCLILSRTDVTAEGLARLADLEGQLHIGELRLTDNDLGFLAHAKGIYTVSLFRNRLTDDAIEHLAQLKHLQYLDVRQTGITEEGLQRLQAELPNCVIGACCPVFQSSVYPGGRDNFPGMDMPANE